MAHLNTTLRPNRVFQFEKNGEVIAVNVKAVPGLGDSKTAELDVREHIEEQRTTYNFHMEQLVKPFRLLYCLYKKCMLHMEEMILKF